MNPSYLRLVRCLASVLLALPLILSSAHAGSATWSLNPTTGDWNTAANWTPNVVPDGPSDVATFAVSNTTEVTEVAEIVFNPPALAPLTLRALPV